MVLVRAELPAGMLRSEGIAPADGRRKAAGRGRSPFSTGWVGHVGRRFGGPPALMGRDN